MGPQKKLEMRYDVIGVNSTGPVSSTFGWTADGGLFVWGNFFQDMHEHVLAHCLNIPPLPQTLMTFEIPPAGGLWRCSVDYWGSIAGPLIQHWYADGYYTNTDPDAEFHLPVTSWFGLGTPPDEIIVTPVRWYETSLYPMCP